MRNRIMFIFSLICGLALNLVYAAEPVQHVFTGELNGRPVIVEYHESDYQPDGIIARVLLPTQPVTWAMNGQQDGNTIHLFSDEKASDHNRATMDLILDGQRAEMIWMPAGQKAQKFKLQPAQLPDVKSISDPYLAKLRTENPYGFLLLQNLTLQQAERQNVQGRELQWWLVPNTELRMFTILDGYPPEILKKINQKLRDRLAQEVLNYHECLSDNSRMGEDSNWYDQTVTPRFFSANVVSTSVFTSLYCGGAHPDFGDAPINLGIVNGEARDLTLDDVLWIGDHNPITPQHDGQAFQHNDNWDDFSSYRQDKFAPWIVKTFTRLYPQQIKAEPEECKYDDEEVWNFPSWYLTPKGIYLGPSFARVMRSCEYPDWPILPYAEADKHPSWFKIKH